jgi:replicative superfamily II helicase
METSVCLAECLPPAAHMVVIKDVKLFQNGVSQEYSDLDITQMIGRAVSLTRLNIMCDMT